MFNDVLESLISRVQEARGVAVIGVDGIPLAGIPGHRGMDLERVAAECTSLIKSATATGRALEHGAPQELVVRCQDAQTLLRTVTPEYFLCLVLGPTAQIGRARYELHKACQRLAGELG